ncbi:ChaN family lipoprotein [Desulfococcus multivorans]|uniref:Haem-binding uptake Tiki superfamily ChaN domain-containing protein n=1 Tax=Desulfococcus multivorans DSM 2059 TaxID=1121405 RepID=S7UZB7_DESML|nr:ChaN family lipoprotein [Desulfococcus multivorans]AQV02973.2 hypothetical protein B2D07_09610 [Desulfococcus multivorans]EPR37738.1 protein of unknown function DUF399 [Desulfococcus multivorans DSM 2059]SJZ46846.1 Uncharacterized iron-regulated protein [Desulfococcus multivorans DSM 2059]
MVGFSRRFDIQCRVGDSRPRRPSPAGTGLEHRKLNDNASEPKESEPDVITKTIGPLICIGVLLLAAGCGIRSPHGRMRAPEAPAVTPGHFRVYDGVGAPATLEDIVSAAAAADVVFIGEEHDDPAAHFLESNLLERLFEACRSGGPSGRERPVLLSLEMFEADVQTVVDEYLADLITERHFLKAARPWPGYPTDYRPLIEFARSNGIPVVAANAPSRYVNRVARLGRSALDPLFPASRAWLPPLPYGEASAAYREKFRNFWEETQVGNVPHGPAIPAPPMDAPSEAAASAEIEERFERLLAAQSLWDAGMAFHLSEALARHPGALALHVNGKFHSQSGLGIPEHLREYRKDVSIVTVTVLSLSSFPAFDPAAAGGDTFIIVTDPSLKPGRRG